MADYCLIQEKYGLWKTSFAKEIGGLYHLINPPVKRSSLLLEANKIGVHCNAISLDIWHSRLGHFLINKMYLLDSIDYHTVGKEHVCEVCRFSKHKRNSFPLSNTRSNAIFSLIHADIWGSLSVHSMNGKCYFLTTVDNFSRFTWVHFIRHKFETKQLIIQFCAYVEKAI